MEAGLAVRWGASPTVLGDRFRPGIGEGTMVRTARVVLVGAAVGLLAGGGPVESDAATEAELQSAVFRAKPAVVMIAVRIGATATVQCGSGAGVVVDAGAIGELGSGSIIHPDGWIVKNGHVLQPYQEGAEDALVADLLDHAVAHASPEAVFAPVS